MFASRLAGAMSGDTTNIMPYIIAMVIAILLLIILFLFKRKQDKEKGQ